MKKIFSLFIVLGLCLIFLPQAWATLDDGLEAFYPFNGNANDETGNGYDGNVHGATLTDDRFGNDSCAYSFDGYTTYIDIGTSLDFPCSENYAISVWFLNNGGVPARRGYGQKIMSKANFFTDFHLAVYSDFHPDPGKGMLRWEQYQRNLGSPGDSHGTIDQDYNYNDYKWHHLVVNKSGNYGEMWVDGHLKGTVETITMVCNDRPLYIGFTAHTDWYQTNEGHWNGKIDDIRIYNRTLSEDEIKMLFQIEKIRIKALIDGRSQLILSENTAQWHHLDYAAPGRHEFRNEPTVINGVDWFPVWPDIPNEENRDCDCFSDVFVGVDPPLPFAETDIVFNTIRSRNVTQIIQHPTKENDFELIIEFDDNAPGGSDDYIAEIEFTSAPNQSPEAICQDVTVSTEPGVCSADASVDDGSFDPDGDEITLDQEPFGPYDLGDTEVTLTVTDDKGASNTCDATVTVVDEEDPVISTVTASPNNLWPPNHKMVSVTIEANATDNCDPEPACQIISVTSNEAVNGLGDGDTASDWVITGDLTSKLRAERSGTGSGRIYKITVECKDQSKNSITATTTVNVPHDMRKKNK
jgi:hypothetical protein